MKSVGAAEYGAVTSKVSTRAIMKSAQNVVQPLTLKTQLSLYGARVPGTSCRHSPTPIQDWEPLLDKGTSTIQGNLYYIPGTLAP